MLRKENIEKYNNEVQIAIGELWEMAFENQKNENDLALIIANGSMNNFSEETLKRLQITNYQIGHDFVHFRYFTFYNFINQYKNVLNEEEYKAVENKQLYDETMVQMQLLAYLKFWETDLILKRLLSLSKLVQGKEYLWDIKQSELNQRRIILKNEIQNPIENLCPRFYAFIDDIYSRQLRNAIAHSQYYIMYDSINLTNKEESKYYELDSITFEKWDEIFTKVILMHNYMVGNFNKYHNFYAAKANQKHNGLRIYFPEVDSIGLKKGAWIKWDQERQTWFWNN